MRYVIDFEDAVTDLEERIGARARSLRRLTALEIPVPPGFAVTDVACRRFLETGDLPDEAWHQVADGVQRIHTAVSGVDPGRPTTFAVRASPPVDMPGLVDSVFDLGWTDEAQEALTRWATPRFAAETRRRFVAGYAAVVRAVPVERIEAVHGTGDAPVTGLEEAAAAIEALIVAETQRPVPPDPLDQLREGIESVFASWDGMPARRFRRANGISDDVGTGVVVHAMVHGGVDDDSGAGIAFSRDPVDGVGLPVGCYRPRSPHLAGCDRTSPVADSGLPPERRAELEDALRTFEADTRDAIRVDYILEKGALWIVEGKAAGRTSAAATRIAVDLVDEGVLGTDEALLRVEADGLAELLHARIAPGAAPEPIVVGTAASPGAATGIAVFDSASSLRVAADGAAVILVRRETTPEDLSAVVVAAGILTSHGGRTSHVAVAARGLGTPAVTGATSAYVDAQAKEMRIGAVTVREGDVLTIDGATGAVYRGPVETVPPADGGHLERLLRWADEVRRLRVLANADTAAGAAVARNAGAEGIGLARTEYMFSGERLSVVRRMLLADDERDRATSLETLEAMQTDDFDRLLEAMDGMPVVVRLLDPPLHEFLPNRVEVEQQLAAARRNGQPTEDLERLEAAVDTWEESNPMLGLRGVRLAVVIPQIYRVQVLAALEAVRRRLDAGGDPRLQLMIPLVSSLDELELVRDMIEEEVHFAGRQLEVGIGTMIELPRAALIAERIALESDFFSFGTNDLTQTTLGLSRDDAEEAFLGEYLAQGILTDNPFQTIDRPGVGRLIRTAIEEGRAANPELEIGVCGEHGGDPRSIAFFHEIGVDYISCSPPRIPVARLAAAQAAVLTAR